MKTILCYGDSNTWGFDAETGGRFGFDERWPGVLRGQLDAEYHVIEEGLNGRTTVWDDPLMPGTNGLTFLRPCLLSHRPIDLVIIMLGSNDLKARFGLPAEDIARGAGMLATAVLKSDAGRAGASPRLLLVAPPPVLAICAEADSFVGSGAKSHQFSSLYRQVSDELGCAFFDAGSVIESCETDGLHLSLNSHGTLGEAMARQVQQLLGETRPI